MAVNDYYWDLAELNPDAILFEEYEGAFMGHAHKDGLKPVAVYNYEAIVGIVAEGYTKDEEYMARIKDEYGEDAEKTMQAVFQEAEDWVDYNVLGTQVGENGPIFLMLPTQDERWAIGEQEQL